MRRTSACNVGAEGLCGPKDENWVSGRGKSRWMTTAGKRLWFMLSASWNNWIPANKAINTQAREHTEAWVCAQCELVSKCASST